MATSNFGWYNDLLNLYSITYDELLDKVDSYCEYHNIDKSDETQYEQVLDNISKELKVFDEYELDELNAYIEELNKKIRAKAYRLSDSKRMKDYDEYLSLIDCEIGLESGYYEGFQVVVNSEYKYLNKTNKQMIQKMFRSIARKFGMFAYTLAYRGSNGETGFNLVKKYKYQNTL